MLSTPFTPAGAGATTGSVNRVPQPRQICRSTGVWLLSKPRSAEQLVEEALAALVPALMAVRRRRIAVLGALLAVRRRRIAVATTAVPLVGRRRVGVVGRRRTVTPVEALLRVGDLLELAAIEDDPSAALALLDVHASPVDGMHPVLTLRTDHPAERTAGPVARSAAVTTSPVGAGDEVEVDRRPQLTGRAASTMPATRRFRR